jgi:hypothetical protein
MPLLNKRTSPDMGSGPVPKNTAADGALGVDLILANTADNEPQHDPLCGRCDGPSGREGAWCDQCIDECREHTRRLDSQTAGGAL